MSAAEPMADPSHTTPIARSVVITGASRGLGFASAVHLYRQGWAVVAAMRDPSRGLDELRHATGAAGDDARLRAVRLDLTDPVSISSAATQILELTRAPFGVVHNAGVAAVGPVEELPAAVLEASFATNVLGPARLTAALLPSMRRAGRGRIVVVSSEAAVHGLAAMSGYAASKAAAERWAESLSMEIAPFGIGVTVLVTGTFDTDIIDRAHTVDHGDPDGPYGFIQAGQNRLEGPVKRFARDPRHFARALERGLDVNGRDPARFVRRSVGPDAVAMRLAHAVLPEALFRRAVSKVMRLPAPGAEHRAEHRVSGTGDMLSG